MSFKTSTLFLLFFISHTAVSGPSLALCLDGDCTTSKQFTIDDNNWQNIIQAISEDVFSAEQERALLIEILPVLETTSLTLLAQKTKQPMSPEDIHDTMNSRDIARNTKAYLALLIDNKLIKHHVIRKIESRTNWLHLEEYAVIIQSNIDSQRFAVDYNGKDYSATPSISPFKDWKKYWLLKLIDHSKTQFKDEDE